MKPSLLGGGGGSLSILEQFELAGADHYMPFDEASGNFLDRIGSWSFLPTNPTAPTRESTVGDSNRVGIGVTGGSGALENSTGTIDTTTSAFMYVFSKGADGPANHGCIISTADSSSVSVFNEGVLGSCKYNSTDAIYSRGAQNGSTNVEYIGPTATAGTAYVVCIVFTGSNMVTYIDGSVSDTSAYSNSVAHQGFLYVGYPAITATSMDYFIGEISDLAVWSGSNPTATEISDLSAALLA